MTARRPRKQEMTQVQRERIALSLLRLRGPGARRLGYDARRHDTAGNEPPLDPETYDLVAGRLVAIQKLTGETCDELCRRLGISGYRRERLVHGLGKFQHFRIRPTERARAREGKWPKRIVEQRKKIYAESPPKFDAAACGLPFDWDVL